MRGKCGVRNAEGGVISRGDAEKCGVRNAECGIRNSELRTPNYELTKVKFDDIAFNSVAKKKPTDEDAAHYIGLEHIDPGSFVVSRWGGDVAPVGDKLLMKKGDVLFGRRRAYQRKVAIAPFDGIFSAHGMVLRPKTDVVDERYFPFFIASDQFMDMAVKISVGGLSPTINWKTLKECEFDLPPIARQRELANLLWAANDLKESYKKAITATDEMLKAKFREMFGDASVRGYVPFADCYMKVLGGKTPSMSRDDFYGGDIPFIKSGDVRGDCLEKGSTWLTQRAIDEGGAKYVPKDSVVVVVRSATLKNELRVAIANCPVVINQDLKAFVPNRKYMPHFLLRVLRLHENALISQVKTMLTSHLEIKELDAVMVPKISLSLQREFVAIAERADAAKSALKQSLAVIEQVMKGLINQ